MNEEIEWLVIQSIQVEKTFFIQFLNNSEIQGIFY